MEAVASAVVFSVGFGVAVAAVVTFDVENEEGFPVALSPPLSLLHAAKHVIARHIARAINKIRFFI